jgi:hypothetical protein
MSGAAVKQRPADRSGVASTGVPRSSLAALLVHERQVHRRPGDVRGDVDRGDEAAGEPDQLVGGEPGRAADTSAE